MPTFLNIERLIALRQAKHWDQKQLAEVAGVDRSVISRLERSVQADCRLSVLIALAAALNAPVETLIESGQAVQTGDYAPDLAAALTRVSRQPLSVQTHAAWILNAF